MLISDLPRVVDWFQSQNPFRNLAHLFARRLAMFLTTTALLGLIANPSGALANPTCRDLFEQPRRGKVTELDLVKDTAAIEAILAQHTPEVHARAKAEAEQMIKEGEEAVKSPRWLMKSGKHALMAGIWFGYLLGSVAVYDDVIRVLRHSGQTSMLTEQYTNFVMGLGYIGVFHHTVCTFYASCRATAKGLNNVYRKVFKKYGDQVVLAARRTTGKLTDKFDKYEISSLVLTATIFTAFNAGYELNGYFDVGDANLRAIGFADGNIDWRDFLAGQTGLVIYYMAEKMLSNKLTLKGKSKPEDNQANESSATNKSAARVSPGGLGRRAA